MYTKRLRKRQKKSAKINSNKSSPPPTINILDDDCLIKIFLYLPISDRMRMERVCKRWQNVNKQSWNDIKELRFPGTTVSGPPYSITTDTNERAVQKLLSRCGRYLNKLEFDAQHLCCSFDIVPIIAKHCHNLQFLILRLNYFTNRDMRSLFSNLNKLSHLELFEISRKFLDGCLKNLSSSLKELSLNTKESANYDSPSSFTHITRAGALSISEMKNLWKLEFNAFLFKTDRLNLIVRNKSITYLSLINCCFKNCINKITNISSLKYLNLMSMTDVEDDFLIKLAENCTNLEQLIMDNCTSVTDTGISALLKLEKLTELKICDLYKVTDAVLSRFINLKVLHCKNCNFVKDQGAIQLIQKASRLEELDLCGTSVTTAFLDAALNVVVSRTNEIPLKIIVNSSVESAWERPPSASSCNLIVEGRDISIWESYWDYSEIEDYADSYDEDFDDDDDDDDDDYDYDHYWGFYGFDEDLDMEGLIDY
ncbi:hypothetical protein PV327_007071 [Microctonus hyperodae]|nr:hypothetical protein PV327_007071 [Microctonus hyperodae]